MTNESTPIAKSLHTIKVIQQVARLYQSLDKKMPKTQAVTEAMGTLGLAGRPDPHGLEEKALRLWKD